MATKYPILLVHGVAIKTTALRRAFGEIDSVLAAEGHTVFVSRIDGFGSVENNAAQLAEEVREVLAQTGAEKVNLIAHSKGGLDAVNMLTDPSMAEKVASLTTICTPYKGSPVASAILDLPDWMLKIIALYLNTAYKLLGDRNPDALAAGNELKRSAADSLPPVDIIKVPESIFCQSYSASVRSGDRNADPIMRIPVLFSKTVEKDVATDGMVPRDSAVFGEYHADCLDESISHSEIIDVVLSRAKRDRIFGFWSGLCNDLAARGF